ncbi:hypothetical protein LOK49_LG05G02014 [Camellia lanceoleosa]|uniref:Uncharacterized protein n=1 Tax=Camellia lanceoleosa TaxID=1840588 RepID=A0ACC0HWS8_9ERIC|nr:hypothetical protein LOK49_LG05G02014 [Camellia lanceoleosa]
MYIYIIIDADVIGSHLEWKDGNWVYPINGGDDIFIRSLFIKKVKSFSLSLADPSFTLPGIKPALLIITSSSRRKKNNNNNKKIEKVSEEH